MKGKSPSIIEKVKGPLRAGRCKSEGITPSRPIVASGTEPKSGCYWCSLLPFSADFVDHKAAYRRDAAKILSKPKEPHIVKRRCVDERPFKPVDILIVGEAPGAGEDATGEPFHISKRGRSAGTVLRGIVDEFLSASVRVGYTNIVRCRPPLNRDPNKTETTCCSPELLRELQARKPKLVMPMGNVSLEFFTGRRGITTVHGKPMHCTLPGYEDLPILPCIHPAYVMRFDHELGRFAEAFELAGEILSGEYTFLEGEGEYHTLTEIEDVEALVQAFIEDGLPTAFDTETGALTTFQTKYPDILCFSFTNEEGFGYVVPYDHAESPWRAGGPKEHERPRLQAALRTFFLCGLLKIAQNEKFDRQHIRHALGVDPTNVRDVMLTHLVLNDQRGTHGLKVLACVYTGMGGYERDLEHYTDKHKDANPEKGGSFANIPGELLFHYAGCDPDATLRVFNKLIVETEYKKNVRFRNLAEHFFPALSLTLADLEYSGALIDMSVIEEMDEELTARMDALVVKIRTLPKVKKFVAEQLACGKHGKRKADPFEFNPGSDQQVRRVLFQYYGCHPVELTDTGLKTLAARYGRFQATHKAAGGNPRDIKFTDVIKDSIEKRKEWDFFSAKADVLHEYERQHIDVAALILEYRSVETLLSTYIRPVYDRLDESGRVHGSFLPHGTVTGRLSSRDPNLQNIPSKARKAYISRFGDEGVILEADYSQIELRVAASWYNEPSMIKAYLNGEDLHLLTAAAIWSLTNGKPIADFYKLPNDERKEGRVRAKRVNFGVLYGIGPPGLVVTLRKDGVFITKDDAGELIDAYFKARPKLKQGMDRLMNDVRRKGYLEAFTGRRRRIPEVFASNEEIVSRALRQSVNFPIQAGASEMTLMSLILINRTLQAEGFKSVAILTVHDSIVFDCHVDEVFAVARLAKNVMENIMNLSDEVMPDVDWKWLKVPLRADFGMGMNWGSLVAFDPDVFDEGGVSDDLLHWLDKKGKLEYRDPLNVDELWELMALKAAA